MNDVWQVYRPIRTNELRPSLINLPAYETVPPAWTGYSMFIRNALVGNSDYDFSIFPCEDAPTDTCVLTVAYKTSETSAKRWKLWEGVGEVVSAPLYTGQRIGRDAYFELWSVEGQPLIDFPALSLEMSLMYSNMSANKCLAQSGIASNSNSGWPVFPPDSEVIVSKTGKLWLRTPDGLYHQVSATGSNGQAIMTFNPDGVVTPT